MTERTPLERRLRRAVVGFAMLCALLVLVVVAVLVYWRLYLLSPSADPFSRGPFVTRLGETSAALHWTLPGGGRVDLVATAPDGTTVAGRGGRSAASSLARAISGRRRWVASAGRRVVPHGAARPREPGHVRRDRRLRVGHGPRVGGRGARWQRSGPTSSASQLTVAAPAN